MDINDISKAPEATKTAEAANREQVTKADDGIRAGSSAEKKDTFRYPQTEDKVRGLCRGLRLLSYKLETRLPIWKTAFLLCDYI
jgi:hypothetical protein